MKPIFFNVQRNEIWCTLKQEISVTKVWKSKTWDDRFPAFSVAVVVIYSVFFSVFLIFMEKFADQNYLFRKFQIRWKKGSFCKAKFLPTKIFLVFLRPSSWPIREVCSRPPAMIIFLTRYHETEHFSSKVFRFMIFMKIYRPWLFPF